MSKLHKALQKSEDRSRQPLEDSFNPMSIELKPTPKKPNNYIYWLVGGLCLIAIPVILLFPVEKAATPELPVAQLTTVPAETVPPEMPAAKIEPQPTPEPVTTTEPLPAPELLAKPAPAALPPTPSATQETVVAVEQRLAVIEPKVVEQSVNTTNEAQGTEQAKTPVKANTPAPAPETANINDSHNGDTTLTTTSRGVWLPKVEEAIADGELEVAEALLKQWLASTTDDETPRIWLARLYLTNGFYRAAEPLLANLTSVDALALQGLIYENTGRFAEAAARFEQLFRNDENNAQWLLLWAINAENDGQTTIALTLYQTFVNQFRFEDENWLRFAQQRLSELGGN